MSDSLWFLVLTTSTAEGYQTPSKALSGGSDGGMYQLSFDLRGAISKLVDESNPEWWEPLDPDDLNLNPQLIVNPTKELENTFDPATFHHHDSKAQDIIDKVLKIEMKQTGDEIMRKDLEYTLQRLKRKKRVPRQLTGNDHGLVPGLEKHLISEHFMKPWLAEEFFNCLAFFLMTRKPNYWRNGKSEILLLHSLEDLNLDDLKDQ